MTKTTGTAAKAAKAVNYSDADMATMTSMYTGKDNATEVKAIAAKLGKSAASVRAKVASMGLYVKAEKATAGKRVGKKAEIVERIASMVTLSEADQEGLGKATAAPLARILAQLTANSEK